MGSARGCARARIDVAVAAVRTDSSYLSQSELPLTFGVGDRDGLDELTIEWPGGPPQKIGALRAGHAYTVTEGKGVTADRPLAAQHAAK